MFFFINIINAYALDDFIFDVKEIEITNNGKIFSGYKG